MIIRLAEPARRMITGSKRGGIRMTFQGLPGPNSTLTLLDEGSYTLVGAVGFLILEPRPCFRNSPKKQARLSHSAMQLVTFDSPAFLVSGPATFCPYVTVDLALSCNAKSVSILFQENFQPSISLGKADRRRLGERCARPLIWSDARRVVASDPPAEHATTSQHEAAGIHLAKPGCPTFQG